MKTKPLLGILKYAYQLRQSGLFLRIIKIYGICTTFHWKKCEKRKPN